MAQVPKWMLVAVLGGVAGALLVEVISGTPAPAQSTSTTRPVGPSDRIVALAGQITEGTYGLYLFDPQHHTVCVYQWQPNQRKLRLMAARNYTFDLRLEDWNTEPKPIEIKKLTQQARRMKSGESESK